MMVSKVSQWARETCRGWDDAVDAVPVSLQVFVIVPSRQLLGTLSVDDDVIVYLWEMMINGGDDDGGV